MKLVMSTVREFKNEEDLREFLFKSVRMGLIDIQFAVELRRRYRAKRQTTDKFGLVTTDWLVKG